MPSPAFTLSWFQSFLLLFSISLSFIRFLSPSLSLSLSLLVRGVGFSCRGARWISDCCRAAQSTLIGQNKPGRRGKGCRKKKKKRKTTIFFHWLHMTIIAPLPFSPPQFPSLSRAAAGYNLNHRSQLCRLACPRLTNDLLPPFTFVYNMQITFGFRNMLEGVKTPLD